MSNLILFYSDQHLREFGSYPPYNRLTESGLTKELENMIEGFKFVADKIREIKPLRVVALGDLYQNTEFQSTRVIHGTHLALGAVKRACDEVGAEHDIIPGNHDILNENDMITAVSTLHYYGNIYLQPNFVDVTPEFKMSLVPAISSVGKAYTWLMEAQQSSDLIATHMDFNGCRYESGYPSDSGLTPDWDVPVISGDIHLPQEVGSVTYVGSLVQHKFYRLSLQEVGGVLTFDVDSKKTQRYPNTRSKHYVKLKWEGEVVDKKAYPPDRCILQVVSSKKKEEVAEAFKDYEHMSVPALQQKSDVKTTYTHFSLDNPEKLLRTHVNKERPDALETYDDAMKGKKN